MNAPALPVVAWARALRPPLPAAALGVGLLLIAGTTAWLGHLVQQDRAGDAAREQALAAAKVHAPEILSYDYRHLDQDFAKAEAALTGKFRGEYARTTSTVVKPVALRSKAVVAADAVAASVIWARPDQAQVLLFVNQQTTSTKIKGPRVDLNRVRMTLRRTDGGWLVSNIEAL